MDDPIGIGMAFLGRQNKVMAAIFQQTPIERPGIVFERIDGIVDDVAV